MNKRVESILEAARALTPEERGELLARLLHEFDEDDADGTPEEIEAAWADELQRRVEKFERGETIATSAEEVHARIRERLRNS